MDKKDRSSDGRGWLVGAIRAVVEGDDFAIRTSELILRPVKFGLCKLHEAQGMYTLFDLLILNDMVPDATARPSNPIDFQG